MNDMHDRTFEEHRQFLFSIAYRMLGSSSDAEDLVQDCYLKWRDVPLEEVRTPRAYLTTMITRLSLNHLNSARSRREEYVGPWLPEPLVTAKTQDPVELSESLTMAFLLLLERLNPVERAVFLLSEVFEYDMAEIARVVDKSPANCRQILHRAKEAIRSERARYQVNKSAEAVVQQFGEAVYNGDVAGLMKLLHEDAVVFTDGGGKVSAALLPIHGADRVTRFLMGIAAKGALDGLRMELMEINRQPGLVGYRGTKVQSTTVFEIADGRIRAIYVTTNPDKLGNLVVKEEHAS